MLFELCKNSMDIMHARATLNIHVNRRRNVIEYINSDKMSKS